MRWVVYKVEGAVALPQGKPVEARNALEALANWFGDTDFDLLSSGWEGNEFRTTIRYPNGQRARYRVEPERVPQP